ncbi:uncharacterized protein LOC128884296 [Hylaeus volcanicus]|uniref:uncharacterized protein LOC128884296 n=1 Tax=Hylaeus volcanicus TaxID=313075 RepID=UPI0023B85550|nr:uncharacterized protein LOC128884296 [Hylaeus volcanicus]
MSQSNLYRQESESISEKFSEELQSTKKKVHKHHFENSLSTPSRSTKKVRKGGIHWDDKVIEEHNQFRGTRMQIKEPKTPFCRDLYCDSMEDDSSVCSDTFNEPPGEYRASTPADISTKKYSFYTQYYNSDSSQDSQCFESSDASSNEILLSTTNQLYFNECPLLKGCKSNIFSHDNL